jgi:hypothetical protein
MSDLGMRAAGRAIAAYYDQSLNARLKSDGNLVNMR